MVFDIFIYYSPKPAGESLEMIQEDSGRFWNRHQSKQKNTNNKGRLKDLHTVFRTAASPLAPPLPPPEFAQATALHRCATAGLAPLAQRLCAAGAAVDAASAEGLTPLMLAAMRGHSRGRSDGERSDRNVLYRSQ